MTFFLNGFAVFALLIGIFALHAFTEYFVRGYIIYQDHGENIVYKERGKEGLNFYIALRSEDGNIFAGGDLHIPTGGNWKKGVPDWAKERREIIVQRLKKHYKNDKTVLFIEE